MKIRTATLADAAAIASVHITSERAAYRTILPDIVLDSLSIDKQEIAWRQRIESTVTTTFVAEEDGNVCGWINFGRSRDSDASSTVAEIRAMYVNPERWRCGVGTALWERTKSALRQASYS